MGAAVRTARPVRERILDAAVSVLQSAGRLAQPQVARAAGVPQGHLTYYFPKRFDLLAAVAGRFAEMVRVDLLPVLGGGGWGQLDEALRARALGFVGKLAKDRARTRMLLGLIVAGEEDTQLRDLMAENVVHVRGVVAKTLGRDTSDPDVDVVLATFWGIGLQHLVLEGRRSDAETDAILARARDWLVAAPPPAATRAEASAPARKARRPVAKASPVAKAAPMTKPRAKRRTKAEAACTPRRSKA